MRVRRCLSAQALAAEMRTHRVIRLCVYYICVCVCVCVCVCYICVCVISLCVCAMFVCMICKLRVCRREGKRGIQPASLCAGLPKSFSVPQLHCHFSGGKTVNGETCVECTSVDDDAYSQCKSISMGNTTNTDAPSCHPPYPSVPPGCLSPFRQETTGPALRDPY